MRGYLLQLFTFAGLLVVAAGLLWSQAAAAQLALAPATPHAAPQFTGTPSPTGVPSTPPPVCGLGWRIVPSPNANGVALRSVAVVATNDVWAVGDNASQTITEHWNGSSWSVVPSPNPGTYLNQLWGVAAVASNDVWAVGSYSNGGSSPDLTLIEHWDGSSWSRVPSPNLGNVDVLNGVAAVSANDVWAVGSLNNFGPWLTLIEHWDGSSWSMVPSPNPVSNNGLAGVAAVSANNVWAVGADDNGTLIEHWDGSRWSIVPDAGGSVLRGVAAVAANDVWAVGQTGGGSLTEHWNGSSWTQVPNPNPPGANYFYGVAAVATNDVWAVGGYHDPNIGFDHTLTEHWDGSSWSVVPSPYSQYTSAFKAVAAVASNDVWAVGYGAGAALTEHYNDPCVGSVTPTRTPTATSTPTRSYTPTNTPTCAPAASWNIVPSPNQGTLNNLYGVAAVSANDVWAVGGSDNSGPPLIEHWNGTSWSSVPSGGSGPLRGVAAIAANDVWAVGGSDKSGPPLIEHWNGTSWSIAPSSAISGTLHGVAAVAANDVWAVGNFTNVSGTLTEHWDGSSWTQVPSPGCCTLFGVSAVASNDVWAVGAYLGAPIMLIEHWNGSSWSSVCCATKGVMASVAAVASNDVWAVGCYTRCPGGMATLHWNGSDWSSVPNPNPSGTLQSVTAVAAHDVWAVGGYTSGGTLTMHSDGSSWSIVPSPNLTGDNNLYGVAAVATNDVWAVGSDTVGASSYTLIEHYSAPLCGTVTVTPTAGASNSPTRTSTPPPAPTRTTTIATPTQTVAPPSATLAPTQTPAGPTATTVPSATHTRVPPTSTSAPSATPRASATPCTIPFTDVHPADYFYGPVTYLYCHGVLSGYVDNTFRPYNSTTRAQMVKIVTLGFAIPLATPPAGAYTFHDVPPSQPFFAYIETAAAHAIVSGYACGGPGEPCDAQNRPYFRPNAAVTRGQLVKIAVGAAGWPLLNPPSRSLEDVLPGSPFYPFVETAFCRGIISGYTCGGPGEPCGNPPRPYFRPAANAARGQIAKIVYVSLTSSASCPSASAP